MAKIPVDEKLNDFLDILPENSIIIEEGEEADYYPTVEPPEVKYSKVDDDYDYARENIKSLLENGKEVLDNIMYLAKEGESPRAYEVAGQLIKTLTDTNKDLIGLAKSAREAKGKEQEKESSPTTVNNTMFIGSTAELQKMLKSK